MNELAGVFALANATVAAALEPAANHLRAILGADGPPVTPRATTLPRFRFDDEFRRLSIRAGVRAAYVLVTEYRPGDGTAALSTGGDATLCGIIDEAMRATVAAEPAEPPESEPIELPGLS